VRPTSPRCGAHWTAQRLRADAPMSRGRKARVGVLGGRLLAQRSNAASACVDAAAAAVHEDGRLLDVGQPTSIGLAVRVADVVPEGHTLATQITAAGHAVSLAVQVRTQAHRIAPQGRRSCYACLLVGTRRVSQGSAAGPSRPTPSLDRRGGAAT